MSLALPCPTVPQRAPGTPRLTVPPCPTPYRGHGARHGHSTPLNHTPVPVRSGHGRRKGNP